MLVVSADDGNRAYNDSFVSAMRSAGASRVTAVHIRTDHGFQRSPHRTSDRRLGLAEYTEAMNKWAAAMAILAVACTLITVLALPGRPPDRQSSQ